MDRSSLVFCVLALVGTLALSALLYPFTTVSPETLTAWRTPAEAETLPDVDLGDFGTVSVLELIEYYIENPPPPPAAGAQPERQVRFQGC
jgi:hypothetical protein